MLFQIFSSFRCAQKKKKIKRWRISVSNNLTPHNSNFVFHARFLLFFFGFFFFGRNDAVGSDLPPCRFLWSKKKKQKPKTEKKLSLRVSNKQQEQTWMDLFPLYLTWSIENFSMYKHITIAVLLNYPFSTFISTSKHTTTHLSLHIIWLILLLTYLISRLQG